MSLLPRVLLTLVLILFAAGAGPAQAGEYPVFACEPSYGDLNRSWVREWNHGGVTSYSVCPPGGETRTWNRGLVTRHAVVPTNRHATVPKGAYAALAFHAPRGASLSRITYTHELCGRNGFRSGLRNAAGSWLLFSLWTNSYCASWFSAQGTMHLGGTSTLRLMTLCDAPTCPVGGATLRGWATMRSATVYVADATRPQVSIAGGSALARGWRRGDVGVVGAASDNVGIRYGEIVAGASREITHNRCDYTLAVPCPGLNYRFAVNTRAIPDGRRQLTLRTQDAAGNWNTRAASIHVDNSAPLPIISPRLAGGDGWRRVNAFSIGWSNPSQSGTAPISAVEIAICPAANPREVWHGCHFRRVLKENVISVAGLRVPRPGQWVARFWLRDAAGNEDRRTAQSVRLLFDDSAPALAFQPADPADPGRIAVSARDAISPIARTEIEIRRRGTNAWLVLPTTRSASGFAAYMDDEHLADGVYDIRARAVDSAGNEQSIYLDPAGAPAARTVPLRIDTRLIAGRIKYVGARRSRGGKRRTRRVVVVRPKTRYGRTVPIRGRLTTPGGNPVANAAVEVWERVSTPGADWRRVALIATNGAGRFRFNALRGPSRQLRFRYPGTPIVRARTTDVYIRVKAATSIRPSRRGVVNGDEVVFRGRVKGGPLPSTGKLIQLQAYSRGMWLTFATPRASAATGRWEYRYRFTATRGTVRYRFRARLPREAGYPYDAGSSRSVSVRVRGL